MKKKLFEHVSHIRVSDYLLSYLSVWGFFSMPFKNTSTKFRFVKVNECSFHYPSHPPSQSTHSLCAYMYVSTISAVFGISFDSEMLCLLTKSKQKKIPTRFHIHTPFNFISTSEGFQNTNRNVSHNFWH